MATFTSNYWVTGETITANKLNGNWGGLVTYNTDEGIPEEGINIGTGLGVGELMNLKLCEIQTAEDQEGKSLTAYTYTPIYGIEYSPNYNQYRITFIAIGGACIYDPTTGILTKEQKM